MPIRAVGVKATPAAGHELELTFPPFLRERGLLCGDSRPAGFDPEDWHPVASDRHRLTAANEAAINACELCPVRRPCLLWALTTPERSGIWGGKTADQRDRMLRRRF